MQPSPQEKEKPKEKEKDHEVPTIIVSSVPAASVVRTVREATSNIVTTAPQELTIRLPVPVSLLSSISNSVINPSPETPKVTLDASDQRTYLSAIPRAVILKPQNTDKQTTLVSTPCKLPAQLDIAYINHHPKALGVSLICIYFVHMLAICNI